jgi:uncharacterized sulfatase
MRQAHAQWAERVHDVGLLAEAEMHARSQGSTPYELGHDPERYDFKSIFSAANAATSGSGDSLNRIVELLAHEDSGVRYWGVTGLLAHRESGVNAGREQLIAALADDSPIVRITAAETLGRFGGAADADAALDVLLEYVRPGGDYYLAVAAWNALDYLDERALPALEAIRAVSTDRADVPPRMGDYAMRLKEKTLADLELPHSH